MDELDELVFNIIESLRNNSKQPNEDTRHHGEKNSYFKMQKNDKLSP